MGISVNPELEEYLGYFFRAPSIPKAIDILHTLPAQSQEVGQECGFTQRNTEKKLTTLRQDAHLVNFVKRTEQSEATGYPLHTWYIDYNGLSDHLGRLRRQLRYALKGK